MRFAISGFIIPFMFLSGPETVLDGTPAEIIEVITTCLMGSLSLAALAGGGGS